MAEETILIDDLNGERADERVPFGLDGQAYYIDLTAVNAKALRTALGPYTDNATKVNPAKAAGVTKSTRSSTHKSRTVAGREQNKAIRDWYSRLSAKERAARGLTGITIAPRGRIQRKIVDAFDEAHK